MKIYFCLNLFFHHFILCSVRATKMKYGTLRFEKCHILKPNGTHAVIELGSFIFTENQNVSFRVSRFINVSAITNGGVVVQALRY